MIVFWIVNSNPKTLLMFIKPDNYAVGFLQSCVLLKEQVHLKEIKFFIIISEYVII